jgi:hypothetical protein
MAGRSSLERLSTEPSSSVSGGRLLFTDEVRREFFHDRKSLWWVRRNVAPEKKIRLGHSTCAWHEEDVRAWLESLKGI